MGLRAWGGSPDSAPSSVASSRATSPRRSATSSSSSSWWRAATSPCRATSVASSRSARPNLDPFFLYVPWIFVILVPAVAMRLWAEERKTGTVELLLTLPVSLPGAYVGKFLAGWSFLGFSLLLTWPVGAPGRAPRRPRLGRDRDRLPRLPALRRSVPLGGHALLRAVEEPGGGVHPRRHRVDRVPPARPARDARLRRPRARRLGRAGARQPLAWSTTSRRSPAA